MPGRNEIHQEKTLAKVRISKASVDATAPSSVGDVVAWDDRIAGFGLKVTPSGSKVYFYRYRIARPGQASSTAPRKYTIGRHGSITPDQARKRAQELAALVSQGVDPRQQELAVIADRDAAERSAEERERVLRDLAFSRVSQQWLDHYSGVMGRRKSGVNLARLVVLRYLQPALGHTPMPEIGRTMLQPIIDAIPSHKRGTRRSVFAYASVLWGWALRRGYVESNVLASMEKPPAPAARERVLTDHEIALLWHATAASTPVWCAFFRLLVLTGQRRSEVSGMMWEELDRTSGLWSIPPSRAKNGKAHLVPLSDKAMQEIDRMAGGGAWPPQGYVLTTRQTSPISGISKAKVSLDATLTRLNGGEVLGPWRLHDLRRTVATGLQRLGVRFEVTEAVLNHVSGAKGGVAGVYQRHDWAEEKRSALDAWASHVEELVTGVDSTNVVRLAVRA